VAVVLVDSSIWILTEHLRVDLRELLPRSESVAVCPMIVQEVLRGTRNPMRYARMRTVLMNCEILDAPTPLDRFEEAAKLFIECRGAGVTPGSVDTLIAACAIAHRIPLLHEDDDFARIARVAPSLQLLTRS
jgi:hypothetical protein